MAKVCHFTISNLPQSYSLFKSKPKPYLQKPSNVFCSFTKSTRRDRSREHWKKVAKKDQKPPSPLIKVPPSEPKHRKKTTKKLHKAPRSLIKVPTWDGNWPSESTVSYTLTLRKLSLADIAQDDDQDKEVLVGISIKKHCGLMISIEGSIITSHTAQCTSCLKPFCRKIDTNFSFWIVPTIKVHGQLPILGKIDPSAIFLNPGNEVDLDFLIRDSIRLAASVKDTCSEFCEKSTTAIWQYIDDRVTFDQRWRKLLEIRDSFR